MHCISLLQLLTCLSICSNAFITADLVRSIHPLPDNLEMGFLRISSYVGTQSSGNGTMSVQSRLPVKGRHVIVVSTLIADTEAVLLHLACIQSW